MYGWRVLTSSCALFNIFALLRLPPFLRAALRNPKFVFKCFSENYLVRSLSVPERTACYLHHYRRLYDAVPECLLGEILDSDVELFRISDGEHRFAVTIGMTRPSNREGELSLLLKANGETLYTLSFTIVPGRILEADSAEALLISRLQGTPAQYRLRLKLAAKAMRGVRAPELLLAALQE